MPVIIAGQVDMLAGLGRQVREQQFADGAGGLQRLYGPVQMSGIPA